MKIITIVAIFLSVLTTHSVASEICHFDDMVGEYTCIGRCQKPGGTAYIYWRNGHLWYENEVGQIVPAGMPYSDRNIYIARDWGELLGDVSNDCSVIKWRNGTTWIRK
jgi:hypothetical protein